LATSKLAAPQLVLNRRMLYTSWIPEDRQACARLLPPALNPAANHAVYMNQYVVDSARQTTGFGAYSLTYLGLDIDQFAPDGVTPAQHPVYALRPATPLEVVTGFSFYAPRDSFVSRRRGGHRPGRGRRQGPRP
jgi:hypothetical protein